MPYQLFFIFPININPNTTNAITAPNPIETSNQTFTFCCITLPNTTPPNMSFAMSRQNLPPSYISFSFWMGFTSSLLCWLTDHEFVFLFLGSQFCSIDLCVCFVTVPYCFNYWSSVLYSKSWSVILPAIFFFFKIAMDIWDISGSIQNLVLYVLCCEKFHEYFH